MPRDHRPATSVRVLLAEDPGTRHGALALLLRMEPGIEVVAQVAAGQSVVETALTHRPDVALLDLGSARTVWTPPPHCATRCPTAGC